METRLLKVNDRICLRNENLPFKYCSHPLPLSTPYLMGSSGLDKPEINITPASNLEAIQTLTADRFRLHVEDLALLQLEFPHFIDLVKKIPLFHLNYPKSLELLKMVRLGIIRHESTLPA